MVSITTQRKLLGCIEQAFSNLLLVRARCTKHILVNVAVPVPDFADVLILQFILDLFKLDRLTISRHPSRMVGQHGQSCTKAGSHLANCQFSRLGRFAEEAPPDQLAVRILHELGDSPIRDAYGLQQLVIWKRLLPNASRS